jgi:rubredoxin
MTDEQKAAYLKSGDSLCPYCRSDNTDSDAIEYGYQLSALSRCLACRKAWRDYYEVTDVEGVDGEADEDLYDQWHCRNCGHEDSKETFLPPDGLKDYCCPECQSTDVFFTDPPVTVALDTVVAGYCREEDDPDVVEESMGEWNADLAAASLDPADGVNWDEVGDCEIQWRMTLRAAFWLRRYRDWFIAPGFYGATPTEVDEVLANMALGRPENADARDATFTAAVAAVTALWADYIATTPAPGTP